MFCDGPIGVFDSGIGGISVLRELRKLMPNENYIYLADIEHAPYGEKRSEEILRYCIRSVRRLAESECKVIVIACNTATAVAVDELRKTFSIPIFGIEPAIKPAAEKGGSVLVLTTDRTAKEERFRSLVRKYEFDSNAKIYTAPVQKLVTYIENGTSDSAESIAYLKDVFGNYNDVNFDSCVLGCTHFPFAKNAIEAALGYPVKFYDGGYGTAKFVKSVLEKNGLIRVSEKQGEILYIGVDIEIITKYNLYQCENDNK